MKPTDSHGATILFNKLKVHFLLHAEESLSILNPFPEVLQDFKEGIDLAWLSFSNGGEETRYKLTDYRPDDEVAFPQRCASNYEFPQSAYIAFAGEVIYLIGSDEAPDLPTRAPLVEEGLVCGALEKKLACHYLKLIAGEIYSSSQEELERYLERLQEFEKTLDCDVPELTRPSQ